MNKRKSSMVIMSKKSLISSKKEHFGKTDDSSFPYIGKAILPYNGDPGRLDIFSFARGIFQLLTSSLVSIKKMLFIRRRNENFG